LSDVLDIAGLHLARVYDFRTTPNLCIQNKTFAQSTTQQ